MIKNFLAQIQAFLQTIPERFGEYNRIATNARGYDQLNRSYEYLHMLLMLVVYEALIAISRTSYVHEYNGTDIWFKLAYNFIPLGTLIFSIAFIVYYVNKLRMEWLGIKTDDEVAREKAVIGKELSLRRERDPLYDFRSKEEKALVSPAWFGPKEPFKNQLNYGQATASIIEGFLWGLLLIIVLPHLVHASLSAFIPNVSVGEPMDTHQVISRFHSNFVQDVALAIGAGFYEETIFRIWLVELLRSFFEKYIDSWKLTWAAVGSSALIFSLSHYIPPFGDTISFYSFIYRFVFGIVMYYIIQGRGRASGMWAHAWYEFFYFRVFG